MRGVLYESIHVDTAYLFPVWVGPPYQELRGACPLLWPFVPPQEALQSAAAEAWHSAKLSGAQPQTAHDAPSPKYS